MCMSNASLEPFASEPPVEEVQGSLGLIHGDHVAGAEDLEESKVATGLNLAILVAVVEFDVVDAGLVEGLLSWPLKSLSPGLVSEPVADEISITGVDQDWDLLENAWNNTVERLHPITLEQEVAVDVEVAAVIAANFNAEF